MHPATKQHIVSMLTMIRTACGSIEAALSQEAQLSKKSAGETKPEADEDIYLSEQQENLLAQMLGFTNEEPIAAKEAQPKNSGKKLNEKVPISKNI